jgi:acetolactate synthase-1/2/3 large subunit
MSEETAEHLTGGEALVRSLVRQGVDRVFGVPGVQTYAFYDALCRARESIRTIGVRHEQAAGYMAFGYAQSSGRPGVFTVVPGPGVLNAASALATANACNTPVLCIAGQVPSPSIGRRRGVLHELPDQAAILRGLTRWSCRVDHPSQIPAAVAEAWRKMQSGRRGAVALEVPWDVMSGRGFATPSPRALPDPPPLVDDESVERAADLLAAATRPMLWVGSGAMHAREEVRELAELLGAAVASFRGGRGVVGDEHPHSLTTAAAWHLWEGTDVLLALGTRAEPALIHWPETPAKLVRVDVDPLEMTRVPPAVGIVGDTKDAARRLLAALRRRQIQSTVTPADIEGARTKAASEVADIQPHADYLRVIREVLPSDGFFVEELCQAGYTAWSAFPVYEPRTYVRGGYLASLGFGYGAALGVKVAHPDRAVVSISGDGGFQLALQELGTAAEHGIGVVAIVFDNGGYGNVRREQRASFGGNVLGADLVNPDFVKLAESYGVAAARVHNPQELQSVLSRALAEGAPFLIEVPIRQDAEASPWPVLLRRRGRPAT